MNETSKTFAFVGAAVAALAIGWFVSTPNPPADGIADELGRHLFPDFVDEKRVAISGAEIIDFDSSTDTKHDLKVARVEGEWEINPEKQGYPEVNAERLAEVVNAVSDLKKLSVASDDRTKHREFGVVDPGNDAELKEGTQGVGKRVDVLDDAKRPLVQLIVGKVDEKNKKLHYVRRPTQDRVYRTEIDADKLSSNFDDWVKPDLLGASGGDLRYANIDDYGIDLEQQRKAPVIQGGVMLIQPSGLEQVARAKAVLEKKPVTKEGATTPTDEWQVADFQTYDKEAKTYKERKLTADEELESFKLSDLGRALGNIKIVDVVKKPKVLAEDLRLEKNFLTNAASPVRKDRESIESLIAYGFRPTQSRTGDEARLICFEGEMTVGFANGVEYDLRFGDITGKGRSGAKDEGEKKDDAAKADDKPADGAAEGANTAPNRYVLVTARFNENLIPKPKLTELPPETPAAATPAAEEKKPTEEKKPEPAKTEEKKPADAKPAEAKKTPTKVEPEDKQDEGSCDQEQPAAAKPADEKKPAEPKVEEKPADDKKPADAKAAATADERKRIESENKAKQEKYAADVKAGREKAKELNDKFADWFYVVSDSTFQGINIDPTTLIRKKPADAAKPSQPAVPNLPNPASLLPQTP